MATTVFSKPISDQITNNYAGGLIKVVQKNVFSNYTMAANELQTYTATDDSSLKETGYTMVGVVGYRFSGDQSSWINLQRINVTRDGSFVIGMRSRASAATSNLRLRVDFLYAKNMS